MKKTKFLALVLVVAIMMMGAGYAYWTETLTINSTVNTGELTFGFEKASFEGGTQVTGSARKNADNDNILDVVFNNMHPGSEGTMKFDMVNKGSIDLYVRALDIIDINNDNLMINSITSTSLNNGNPIGLNVKLSELAENLPNGELRIDVGDRVSVEMVIGIDPLAVEGNFAEDSSCSFKIVADILQYNDARIGTPIVK